MTGGVLLAALAIGVPALAFALWPVWSRRRGGRALLALPVDPRQQLAEEKRAALRALRELEFEHEAGHIGDDDYADLRTRYERETAAVLTELDRLGPAKPADPEEPEERKPREETTPRRSAWRHPVALGTVAVVLVVFGIVLGAGIARHTAPDQMAGMPPPASRPLASPSPEPGGGPGAGSGPARPVTPDVLQGMLQAARASLFEGRYGDAISAYQAILKRDPKNVDAMTHLGLIVAIGGHADSALETFEKALAIDPNFPPALLYRGQVLYEAKKDPAGAIRSWEKFLAVAPAGEDRARVEKLIAEARARRGPGAGRVSGRPGRRRICRRRAGRRAPCRPCRRSRDRTSGSGP